MANKRCSSSITSDGHGADPGFLAVIPQVTLVVNPMLDCRYFTFRQTRSYFPDQRNHSLGRYQIILLSDRGTQVSVACPRPLRNGAQPELEPATCDL